MKKIILSALVVAVCTTGVVIATGNNKVTVCHKDHHNITISENALPAHLAHGDRVGPCERRDDRIIPRGE